MNYRTLSLLSILSFVLLFSCKEETNPSPINQPPVIVPDTVCLLTEWSHGFTQYTLKYNDDNQLIGYDDDLNWSRTIEYDAQGRVTEVEYYLNGNLQYGDKWKYEGNDSLPYQIALISSGGDTISYRKYSYKNGLVASNTSYSEHLGIFKPRTRELYTYDGSKILTVLNEKYIESQDSFFHQHDYKNFIYDDKVNPFNGMFWYFYYNDFNKLPLGNNIKSYENTKDAWNLSNNYFYNAWDLPDSLVSLHNGVQVSSSDIYTYECK